MSDIVVRVPKARVEHFWQDYGDDELNIQEFWALPSKPKRMDVGDFVWFQIGQEIVARACVRDVDAVSSRVGETCLDTGFEYVGRCFLWWRPTDFEKLDEPIAGYKNLVRGFMYKEI